MIKDTIFIKVVLFLFAPSYCFLCCNCPKSTNRAGTNNYVTSLLFSIIGGYFLAHASPSFFTTKYMVGFYLLFLSIQIANCFYQDILIELAFLTTSTLCSEHYYIDDFCYGTCDLTLRSLRKK